MSDRDHLFSLKEWLGFAAWLAMAGALVYWDTQWGDKLAHRHAEPPASPHRTATAWPASELRTRQAIVVVRPEPIAPRVEEPNYPFHTLEFDLTSGSETATYQRRGFDGVECTSPYLERGAILSEDQANYRAARSACGPTAILDWLIWYQNFGLVPRSTRNSDLETYKRVTFDLIDRELAELRGRFRSELEGANTAEIIMVFDKLVSDLSRGKIRLDCEIKDAPLLLRDLLDQSKNYRAGILIVQVYDPLAPPIGGFHAVAVVRTDIEGRISIANWGKYEHGRLITRPDGQWFASEDRSRPSMKVRSLLTFIPFRPQSQ